MSRAAKIPAIDVAKAQNKVRLDLMAAMMQVYPQCQIDCCQATIQAALDAEREGTDG